MANCLGCGKSIDVEFGSDSHILVGQDGGFACNASCEAAHHRKHQRSAGLPRSSGDDDCDKPAKPINGYDP